MLSGVTAMIMTMSGLGLPVGQAEACGQPDDCRH